MNDWLKAAGGDIVLQYAVAVAAPLGLQRIRQIAFDAMCEFDVSGCATVSEWLPARRRFRAGLQALAAAIEQGDITALEDHTVRAALTLMFNALGSPAAAHLHAIELAIELGKRSESNKQLLATLNGVRHSGTWQKSGGRATAVIRQQQRINREKRAHDLAKEMLENGKDRDEIRTAVCTRLSVSAVSANRYLRSLSGWRLRRSSRK